MSELLQKVIDIAQQAGDAIMKVYQQDVEQTLKTDESPLTEADLAAHRIIVDGLAKISDLPCLSEESEPEDVAWSRRRHWSEYWLVDPLDGTKEFIHKNDEFTVNIALIKNGKAVMGVVYCPPRKCFYFAQENVGAFKKEFNKDAIAIHVMCEPQEDQPWFIVGSRRHGTQALQKFADTLGDVQTLSMGSSLKLCLVAEGKAHLYPRLALTSEWDTAAAQAIVESAGGQVLSPTLEPLQYGQKENLLNPYFIVCAKRNVRWEGVFSSLAMQDF